ncbi:hypothetical protein ACFQ1S_28325, partial [Kibdelosporangium lantanae]
PPATQQTGYDPATSTELPERRTENERVYTNTDGTETTEFSTAKVNFHDQNGQLTPIDPTLVADHGWRNKADDIALKFAEDAGSPDLVTMSVDADHSVSYGMTGATTAKGTADGATVTYPDVRSNVDLKVESQPGGVKETLVLKNADTPRTFTFPLRLRNLTPKLVDNQVVLTDEKGTQRAVIPAGDMVDAQGVTATVNYLLNGTTLTVTVDETWLRDPGRVFPVSVDPTIQLPVNSGVADSSLSVSGGGSSPGGQQFLTGPNSAGYVKFADLVNKLQYHTIFGAQLWLVNYDAESCNPRQVTVHPVTESWDSSTNKAYPGPAVGDSLATAQARKIDGILDL